MKKNIIPAPINTAFCDSSVGRLFLTAEEDALIGLWIEGQKHFLSSLKEEAVVYHTIRRNNNLWCDCQNDCPGNGQSGKIE